LLKVALNTLTITHTSQTKVYLVLGVYSQSNFTVTK